MPLPLEKKGDQFLLTSRVYVDSSERIQGTPSDYRVKLRQHIQDVVAIELTGFAMPSSLTPTFREGFNNKIDFELSTAGDTVRFTVTMPSFSYAYQNVNVPYLSFTRALEQELQSAVVNDPVFGFNGTNTVLFDVKADPEQKTLFNVRGVGFVQFRFLFASGPNSDSQAHAVLGFDKLDYAFGDVVQSPRRTLLEPFRTIEIYIDEFPELQPVAIIYNTNSAYYGQTYQEVNLTRARFLSSSPPQRIEHLTIHLRTEGVPVEALLRNEHSLSFTFFSLAYEDSIPHWLHQQISL